jgi:pathogenesis-related protein 1
MPCGIVAAALERLGAQSWFGTVLILTLSLNACSSGDDEGADGNGAGSTSLGGNATGSSGSGTSQAGSNASSGSQAMAGGGAPGGGMSTAGSTSVPVDSDFPDAQAYVDAHNAVRAAVEAPSNYAGTWQPLAPVSWSNEIAATAQEWANHLKDTMGCGLEHAQGTGYGENLAGGTDVGAQKAVDMWAAEKKNYTYSPDYEFDGNTGHYTQIVWRKSTHIGCASAKCPDSNVVACRYDPPGNFIGDDIF